MRPVHRRRLLLTSLWPVGLVLVAIVASVSRELIRDRWNRDALLITPPSMRISLRSAMARILPSILILSFVMVPSTSTRIFKSFLCDVIEYDGNTTRRYLHDDLSMSCDSSRYDRMYDRAVYMILIWPLGIPSLYVLLLCMSRRQARRGVSTPLSRAVAFLSGDYKDSGFLWEPLDMCRKLTLTGVCIKTASREKVIVRVGHPSETEHVLAYCVRVSHACHDHVVGMHRSLAARLGASHRRGKGAAACPHCLAPERLLLCATFLSEAVSTVRQLYSRARLACLARF